MVEAIGVIYWFFIGACIFCSVVVVFHLIRYSFNKAATVLMLLIFIPVTAALIFVNFLLFSSIDMEELIPHNNLTTEKSEELWKIPF